MDFKNRKIKISVAFLKATFHLFDFLKYLLGISSVKKK